MPNESASEIRQWPTDKNTLAKEKETRRLCCKKKNKKNERHFSFFSIVLFSIHLPGFFILSMLCPTRNSCVTDLLSPFSPVQRSMSSICRPCRAGQYRKIITNFTKSRQPDLTLSAKSITLNVSLRSRTTVLVTRKMFSRFSFVHVFVLECAPHFFVWCPRLAASGFHILFSRL